MADKDKLRDMLDNIIDSKPEQAEVAFHGYLEDKMKDMLRPVEDEEEEKVVDDSKSGDAK